MAKKLTVHIQGYGEIKIKKPKEYNEETWGDGIADAVAKVMTLTHPGTQKKRFHPVLGLGGYIEPDTNAASAGRNSEDAQRVDPDG